MLSSYIFRRKRSWIFALKLIIAWYYYMIHTSGAFLSMSSTAVVTLIIAFVGAFLSMSSTAVDCAVGLLFALLPILGGTSGVLQGVISMTKSLVTLMAFLIALTIMSRTCVPWFLKLMISLSSQTNELYQLAAVAFCLLVAWCSDKLGLSFELGSFAAGVMIATTDLAQHTLEQVGMSLAQIGEFAFVLLSRASNLHLVEGKLFLLFLGTTALSLVTTPLLFKLIPAVVHLGILLRWFPPILRLRLCSKERSSSLTLLNNALH